MSKNPVDFPNPVANPGGLPPAAPVAPAAPPPRAPPAPPSGTSDIPFDRALSQRYLVYALSTITARSLPDLRDGLKPVHRRLLWAMRVMRLDPAKPYKKSARVVGNVIGLFHPHGDSAVYDAMVRMAQDFALRYPLVDGQGNFGNIDGDNAAAYRYTEARLTQVAIDVMDGLDEETVDFHPTYNGEDVEPTLMPGLFPNLLANGASGIAVGMATNIPPHNVAEIIDAAMFLIDQPDAPLADLLGLVPGPDFPTGGIIVDNPDVIAAIYHSGRGSLRLRARFSTGRDTQGQWEPSGIERLAGGAWQLVISEIPYGTAKSKLIEQIAARIIEKKLPILDDVRDESDESIRIVLIPKHRTVDPEILKQSLYQSTDLESRFACNFNVLDATLTPHVMGLKPLLTAWLEHQIIVFMRRAEYRTRRIDERLALLTAYRVVALNLDRIIEIIRAVDAPEPALMTEFNLTQEQARAILDLRLRALRMLEQSRIEQECDTLCAERAALAKLLTNPAQQKQQLKQALAKLRKYYSGDSTKRMVNKNTGVNKNDQGKKGYLLVSKLGARRTSFAPAAAVAIPRTAMISREAITVILSQRGWIRTQRGHIAPDQWAEFKYKEGDGAAFSVHSYTTDRVLVATSDGSFYTLCTDNLPSGRGFGEPLRVLLDIDSTAHNIALLPLASADGDRETDVGHRTERAEGIALSSPISTPPVSSIASTPSVFAASRLILLATSDGRGFMVERDKLIAETRKGRRVVHLKAAAQLSIVRPIAAGDDSLAVVGDNRKLLVFPLTELPTMHRGQGVILQRYRGGGELSDAVSFALDQGLRWAMGGKAKRTRTADVALWCATRGSGGKTPPDGFPRNNKFG